MALHLGGEGERKKKERQEADNTMHKLLQTQTSQMTLQFWQIHLPKLNLCSKVWGRQQVSLVSNQKS